MHELVEMEVRELLSDYDYDGDNTSFIKGSALESLNGVDSEFGIKSIEKLLKAMDDTF
jgi:elongation factor Tu